MSSCINILQVFLYLEIGKPLLCFTVEDKIVKRCSANMHKMQVFKLMADWIPEPENHLP